MPARRIVDCVACGDPIPLTAADVVGLGFRCAPCGLRADVGELTGVPDVASHLCAGDRARFAEDGRRLAQQSFTIAGAVAAGAVIGFAVAPDAVSFWLKLFLTAITCGLGFGGLGLARWRRFR